VLLDDAVDALLAVGAEDLVFTHEASSGCDRLRGLQAW
jgi:hypothetical protein